MAGAFGGDGYFGCRGTLGGGILGGGGEVLLEGTGINGGGTGKWVKAWLEEVAEHGVRLSDECVTRGLLGAVWRPPLWVVVTAAGLVERSTGVVVNLNWRPGPSRPALFGDLLWNALFRPPASTKCLN